MRKIMIYISISLLVIISIAVIVVLSNPLRNQTEDEIRESMLELTPIGLSLNETVEVLKEVGLKRKWEPVTVNDRVGVIMGSLGRTGPAVGVQSIRVTIGKYRKVFETAVVVWWAFDEDLVLVDVFVRKQTAGF